MQKQTLRRTVAWLLILFMLLAEVALAQTKAPSAILNQYRNQRTTWFTLVWPYANTLFGLLAVIEFAWSAAVMLLERSDLQSWTSALVRKLMWLGAFYALLVYGRFWIPAIIDSFEMIGQRASGSGPLSPSDVFSRGLDLAGALMATSSAAAFFTNLGTSLTMVVTGIITALAFTAITVQFVVAMVESYIIVAVGFIFLGFGGSRWTAPYVERYIALGVANGVKIMLLYLLVGTGMNLSVDWMTEAQKIAAAASPAMSALEIMGASIIFMMLCWHTPKLFAAVLGGSPALAGGDLIGAGAFLAGGAIAVGSAGLAAVGAIGAAGASAGGAVASGGSSGNGAAGGGSSPAMLASVGSAGKEAGSVPPPDTSSVQGAATSTGPHGTIASDNAGVSPGFNASVPPPATSTPKPGTSSLADAARRLRDIRRGMIFRLPTDAGPAASPPRMNLDHHD
jgi:type IV secretion system protein TrbL